MGEPSAIIAILGLPLLTLIVGLLAPVPNMSRAMVKKDIRLREHASVDRSGEPLEGRGFLLLAVTQIRDHSIGVMIDAAQSKFQDRSSSGLAWVSVEAADRSSSVRFGRMYL